MSWKIAGACVLCVVFAGGAFAQDARKAFADVNAQWKQLDAAMQDLSGKFRSAPPEQREAIRAQFNELTAQARKLMPQLQNAAVGAYRAAPNQDKEVIETLMGVAADALRRDDYEASQAICDMLLQNKCQAPQLFNLAGVTSYGLDNFAGAESFLKEAEKAGVIGDLGANFLRDAPQAKRKFEREVALRKAEAATQDLPVVKFETNKGVITIELYENEAPQTVGNFISLVESGFYNRKTFHRVLPNFMAQGGCPKGDGTGGPGYRIPCECYAENHREHFRGTLSMAHAGRDTGGSQFFITFLRTPHLDGKHTVFGRVVDGLDVLAKLQRRDPDRSGVAPDEIIKAEVLRKRPHEYAPNKLPE